MIQARKIVIMVFDEKGTAYDAVFEGPFMVTLDEAFETFEASIDEELSKVVLTAVRVGSKRWKELKWSDE